MWGGREEMKKKGYKRRERGTASVELAVVLPVILTLLFGIIEFGWLFMINQTLTTAAREGCRTAVVPGAADDEITAKVSSYMTAAGLSTSEYQLTITHATTEDPTETVTITVPYGNISLLGNYFGMDDLMLQGYAAMRKEGE
jgi:Flp pilus assembly protein TadG